MTGVHIIVCQGRICQGKSSQDLHSLLEQKIRYLTKEQQKCIRLLTGGCFGACKNRINIVLRTYNLQIKAEKQLFIHPNTDDTLQLTHRSNERLLSNCDYKDASQILNRILKNL